jgi:hypothetical protein
MMKKNISILIIAIFFYSCGSNSQTKAIEKTAAVKDAIKPGTVGTTASGYTMNAKINGSNWVASFVMPPAVAGRIVGYHDKDYIGLHYSKTDMAVGKKITIDEDNAVDLLLNDGCLYTSPKGVIEITKVDEQWAEGKFFFTTACNNKNKIVEVKDGFFRIPFSKNK